jgi:hypothetical protein
MAQAPERDFPIGHPAAIDTRIGSPEHLAWIQRHKFEENARDFPPGHPKAVDTPGNLNSLVNQAGVDPHNPHLEAHTGRTPAQAAAVAEWNREEAAGAHESPVMPIIDAAVLNEALAAERERLGVDSLTMEETQEVMARLHDLALKPPLAPRGQKPARIRLTLEQVKQLEHDNEMPQDWYPTTGKPWYGPPD